MSNVTNYMSPEELNAYAVRRQQANTLYSRQRSNLDYQRGNSEQDRGIGNARIGYSWDQAFKKLPGAFARRGILRSGLYNKGYSDYNYNRENADFDFNRQANRRMEGYQNQQDDYEAGRTMGLTQIDSEQNARQAALSAEIQNRRY